MSPDIVDYGFKMAPTKLRPVTSDTAQRRQLPKSKMAAIKPEVEITFERQVMASRSNIVDHALLNPRSPRGVRYGPHSLVFLSDNDEKQSI